MKTLFTILLYLFMSHSILLSQSEQVDSLWNIWSDDSMHDTTRFEALKQVIIKQKFYSNNLDTSVYLTNKIINQAISGKEGKWISEGYRLQGLSYYFHGNYDSAIQNYTNALQENRKLNDKKGESGMLHNMAIAYRKLGDLPKSLECNLNALEVRRSIHNEKGEALSLQSIATVYYHQNKYEESLEFALKAYLLSERIAYDIGMANAAVSAANAYSDLEYYSQALEYYERAVVLYKQLKRPRNEATCYDNIGNNYFKQNDFSEALKFQKRAFNIRKSEADKSGLTLSYINIGSSFYKLNQYKNSISNCLEGLILAEETKSQRFIFNAYDCLYKTYESKGDIDSAFKYFQLYVSAKDSIEGIEKTKLVEEIESRYELKEKEAVIAQSELDIATEKNKRSNTIIISLVVVGLLLALLAGIRERLQKRRREAELLAEKEHLEAEKLRELDRLKSSFFTNISHEIRTPLTLIMSPLEQMLNGTLKGDLTKYQNIMFRNGKRLQDLINQLLDLSKVESGYLQLNLEEADLSGFLKSLTFSFSGLADRKQIDYGVDGVPDEIISIFDKDVFEKILMNLISNAFKFTPEEGIVKVNFTYSENQLIASVSDTGIGIPASEIQSIFKKFYSADPIGDVQKSSGLGLALTKELVDLCDGRISVESKEEQGSIFTVYLPLIPVEGKSLSNDLSERLKQNLQEHETSSYVDTDDHVKPHVLVVEDNEDVRIYLKDQLMELYKVSEAANGESGLKIARSALPDLIVSDIMMPIMDGNEMCRLLKSDPLTSHIPIILLTAKGEQKDVIEGLETGADAYLKKPFDQAELQIRIHNLIEQRRQLRQKFTSDFKFAPSELLLTSLDATFLENVRAIIEENMDDETFSVIELSKELGMSRSNLFRKLKALTDQSPNQVIREMRLIRAKEYLESGVGNATEVAFMVGFNSATYFSKCFSGFFGIPPSKVS